MTKSKTEKTKEKDKMDPVEARINRVEGQVKAIKKMYVSGKRCTEVVQQVQAARAALAKVASMLLTDEVKRCAEKGDTEELEKVMDRTFKTI